MGEQREDEEARIRIPGHGDALCGDGSVLHGDSPLELPNLFNCKDHGSIPLRDVDWKDGTEPHCPICGKLLEIEN